MRGRTLRLSDYVIITIKILQQNELLTQVANIQKVVYFSLPKEKRNELFQRSSYGLYSESIQTIIGGLTKNKKIDCIDTKYQLSEELPDNGFTQSDVTRIELTVNFLKEKNIKEAKEISNLAKVHLFCYSNEDECASSTDFAEFIQERSEFLGWQELANQKIDKIIEYLDYSKEIETSFNSPQ